MALTLKDRRLRAHAQQDGLCFYCCLPICEGDMQPFRRRYGLTAREAESLLSTAEHLVARKDGGTDGNSNVVAACWTCNEGRHQRKNRDLDWLKFRTLVQNRMRQRKWRPRSLLAKILSSMDVSASPESNCEETWRLAPMCFPARGIDSRQNSHAEN